MSKLTQKAIKESFLRLLDRKPIDHIKITDITNGVAGGALDG